MWIAEFAMIICRRTGCFDVRGITSRKGFCCVS
jgi:hypothetical protein